MLSQRLKYIMEILGVSHKQLAGYSGFDRTNISRILNKKRTPAMDSVTMKKLVNGIFLFAENHNKLEELLKISKNQEWKSDDEIKNMILLYLCEGDIIKNQKEEYTKLEYYIFGKRLDMIMTLIELSNIRLSKILSVDASLISRFRTGERTPKSNQKLAEQICQVIMERIIRLEKQKEVAALIGILPEQFNQAVLNTWLLDSENIHQKGILAIEHLVGAFDAFSLSAKLPLPSFEEIAPREVLCSSETMYFGVEGIRTAVIRFLGNAALYGAKELWLYSDQNIDWLVGDPVFFMRWANLMVACVKKGIRIKMIHSIDRNLEEMFSGIKSWVPLYMSGMIQSFYLTKSSIRRFSYTIFLCPGISCIQSCHSVGMEEEGIYYYYTDEKNLLYYKNTYQKLLLDAKTLIKTFVMEDIVMPLGGLMIVQSGLSIATMPKELVDTLDIPDLERHWKHQKMLLEQHLQTDYIYECITLESFEALSSGKIAMPRLTIPQENAKLYYSPKQYAIHIRNILELLDHYPNYRVIILPEIPFENVKIIIGTKSIVVIRTTQPFLSFHFSHPLMCKAFQEYANLLIRKHKQDKKIQRKNLEKYI